MQYSKPGGLTLKYLAAARTDLNVLILLFSLLIIIILFPDNYLANLNLAKASELCL